jgi:hypothetical protein
MPALKQVTDSFAKLGDGQLGTPMSAGASTYFKNLSYFIQNLDNKTVGQVNFDIVIGTGTPAYGTITTILDSTWINVTPPSPTTDRANGLVGLVLPASLQGLMIQNIRARVHITTWVAGGGLLIQLLGELAS